VDVDGSCGISEAEVFITLAGRFLADVLVLERACAVVSERYFGGESPLFADADATLQEEREWLVLHAEIFNDFAEEKPAFKKLRAPAVAQVESGLAAEVDQRVHHLVWHAKAETLRLMSQYNAAADLAAEEIA
jgi:hypothetical protein